jgi:hypothetical protein
MTRDPDDGVEEFFARERGEVRELTAGPDHWEGVLREARRPTRRLWPLYLGAAAAAALAVAGYTVWGPGGQTAEQATTASGPVTATVTRTVTASTSPATSASGTGPSQGPTGRATALPAPATFAAASLTNAGAGHLFSLGSARCGNAPCVAVVASDDDGQTWTTRASFQDLVLADGRLTPEAANQLTGVRFASPQIGYAYGSKAFRTTDGGRSWQPFDVGGQRVLSLETDGTRVWLVTAAQCRHGQAAGTRGCTDLRVWSAPTSATAAQLVQPLTLPGAAETAWLSLDGHDAYVSVSFADDSQVLPVRVSGRPQQLARPTGCAGTGGVWVWGTADSPGTLLALCRSSAANPAYALARSSDRGSTWSTAVPVPDLGAPGYAGAWLAASDRDHLVAVARALPTSSTGGDQPTSVLSSADGGRTWAPPQLDQPSDSWWWAGSPGRQVVYLLGGAPGAYAVSSDGGATFGAVGFRK